MEKMFHIICEEYQDFGEGFYINANNFEEVNKRILDLIDIHEVDKITKKIID